jgi:serine/threonine protein kinase
MPTTQQLESQKLASYSKKPGMKPLPGYVLIEPLGQGGFGEVWKCEAPGGLHKAMKFVAASDDGLNDDDAKLRQELEAFQQVKAIRHPYLLCLERVELVKNELVMVMGLADQQLGDRFLECQQAGLQGIPRDELLGYLMEAAEALDVISTKHGLQHLDVKPANLFLTGGHVQVGDYGLVSKLEAGTGVGKTRGLTPKYAAPEVLLGQVHTQSDQYSLALVYQELLTGTFPYSGRNSQQIIMQHASAVPDLSHLPERDRGPVATALAKQPGDRFPSCRAFIKALISANISPHVGLVAARLKSSTINRGDSNNLLVTPAPRSHDSSSSHSSERDLKTSTETTNQNQLTEIVPTIARVPRLVGIERTPPPSRGPDSVTPPKPSPPPVSPQTDLPLEIRLQQILSVLPVGWLRGHEAPDPDLPPNDMIRAVLAAASKPGSVSSDSVGVMRESDGNWKCRFLTTIDPRVAKVKLDLLWEQGGLTMDSREERRVIFRKNAPIPAPLSGFSLFGKKPPPPPPGGFEIVVELPEPGIAVGEIRATGQPFGTPPPDFFESSGQEIKTLLEEVRKQLNNFPDRRKHPRIPADFQITLFPLNTDYRVEAPVRARCENVSAGGLALRLTAPILTKYAYVTFEGIRGTTGLAVLVQITRTIPQEDGVLVSGKYRLDLWPKRSH